MKREVTGSCRPWAISCRAAVALCVCLSSAFGPAHGIQLQRGPHAGRLLVGAVQNGPNSNGAFGVFSDDGGITWQRGAGVEAEDRINPSESVMVELVDGRIQMNSRNRGGHERPRAVAFSRDGGATFPQKGLAE